MEPYRLTTMTTHPASRLAAAATTYCALIERLPRVTLTTTLRRLHRALLDVYVEGVALPSCRRSAPRRLPEPARAFIDVCRALHARLGPHSGYQGVFDPLDESDVGMGLSLVVDLADTWEDLERGLILWRSGKRDVAHAFWKLNYTIHWGRHAADGLRVLHHHVETPFPTGR
jgi:hypothetical protein